VVQAGVKIPHYVPFKQLCVAKVWYLKDHHISRHKEGIHFKHLIPEYVLSKTNITFNKF